MLCWSSDSSCSRRRVGPLARVLRQVDDALVLLELVRHAGLLDGVGQLVGGRQQLVDLGLARAEVVRERLEAGAHGPSASPSFLPSASPTVVAELGDRADQGLEVGLEVERGDALVGIGVDRVPDVERVLEDPDELFVRRVTHRAQERRDRQLALAVDAREDLALLVDLDLEPGAAVGHQVRQEDLLLRVLRLHDVGAGRTDELRDDHALGAVDDERAVVGHPREVAHEDRLLADLTGLAVLERDADGQRARVGQVLLAALRDRRGGLVEVELTEDDGEVAGVVLDRRDVVDRLAEKTLLGIYKLVERILLDPDQIGQIQDVSRRAKLRR